MGNFGFMPFLFILLVVLILWRIFRRRGCRSDWNAQPDSPLEIAKRRYARGEITKEEFEEIRKNLA